MINFDNNANGDDSSSEGQPSVGVINLNKLVDESVLHLNDRVERHNGSSERSQWGTITARITENDRDLWLVVDNAGATHADSPADLSLAIRGRGRRP